MELANVRVTVFGLGRHGGGVGVVRHLVARQANVLVTDRADAATLSESLAALADLPVRYSLGGHRPADFDADLVVVNPAIPPGDSWLARLAARGIPLATEIELFLRACPARVIAVTGSNGKSTTTSLIGDMLRAAGNTTWQGGNLGGSLLADLPRMKASDWCVLELSSFQLERLNPDRVHPPLPRGPAIAVVTNFSPNHLDWHGTLEDYAQAKQQLLRWQGPDDVAVLNQIDAGLAAWPAIARGRVVPPCWEITPPNDRLPGNHNRANVACAVAAARAAGCEDEAIRRAIASYQGLPHRIEFVAEIAGRKFYNDSKATTPAASLAALEALGDRVWLLAGGSSKGTCFESWRHGVVRHARGAALFGQLGPTLASSLRETDSRFSTATLTTLEEALEWCWRNSQPGECILLSPACASFDQYRDFTHRGEQFVACVRRLANRGS